MSTTFHMPLHSFLPVSFPLSVMLLDNGRMVEYNPPGELLSNKKSSFYAMAKDADIVG